jgi:hypothetical protein
MSHNLLAHAIFLIINSKNDIAIKVNKMHVMNMLPIC